MADEINIKSEDVHVINGRKKTATITVSEFASAISDHTIHGLRPEANPDNTKWIVGNALSNICVVELKPELRWIKWISDDSPVLFGPGVITEDRQLSTPYVVVIVPFRRQRILPRVQVFYRNEPLRTLDGDGGMLYWPNLLNVSPNAYGCLSWFCTQYLKINRIRAGIPAGLEEVCHYLFAGDFSKSSEAHEGESTMSKAVADGIDSRVTDVNRWQEHSLKEPQFVLSVDWKSTENTVRDIIEQELKQQKVKPVPHKASELVTLALRKKKKK